MEYQARLLNVQMYNNELPYWSDDPSLPVIEMPRTADDAAYLARLQDYYSRWRSLPAYQVLRTILGLATRSGVAVVLRRLERAGYLERTPAKRWTPTARFFERPLADAPVPAGYPTAVADGGETASIDAWLVREPSRTVVLPVTGDSMWEAGIYPGDRVVVERDQAARPGDLVVAVVDNEFTLKTLAVEEGAMVLRPANPRYPVLRPERWELFGVVVGLVRNYRK